MEGLGVAANVIAVVDISSQVIKLCVKYAQDVKHAKEDKVLLSQEVTRLNLELQIAQDLLSSPKGTRLQRSQALSHAISKSEAQLRHLEKLLTCGHKPEKAGWDALKWPFKRKEVNEAVRDLRRCTETISSALQVDQTAIIIDIEERAALDRLPFAEGASFDSYAEGHTSTCLPGTRVQLLDHISRWIDDPGAKTVFWLNGMAGTGKSTISRTVARLYAQSGSIGASFFFKRGETDRATLAKFSLTIARQLAVNVPEFVVHIKDAIDADPIISGKAPNDQFEKLIMRPLSKVHYPSQNASLVFVIDALDECKGDADVRFLINLFCQAQSHQLPQLRVFITSRPELPIRLGFGAAKGTYQDLVLHKIPTSVIENDIFTFLHHELGKIRDSFNVSVGEDRKLPAEWPGQSTLQILVTTAVPLFIFAATICRFINDRKCGNPKKQLEKVLGHNKGHGSKLSKTYAPVLSQQLDGVPEDEKNQILQQFHFVVGTIVTLASPLSTLALSRILDIPLDNVEDRLDMLHSVLSVPSAREAPVQLLHLSFRDYLVDPQTKNTSYFWIDEEPVHRNLARQCLRIMRLHLRENICSIQTPSTYSFEIDAQHISQCLSPELQYACLYWIHHVVAVVPEPDDTKEVYDFLTEHLLHWLEVMSLIGRAEECHGILQSLRNRLQSKQDQVLSEFCEDAVTFIKSIGAGIKNAPLQIYSSALLFAPKNSIVRKTFEANIPKWISVRPHVRDEWFASLWTLEGHHGVVKSIVFSHDSKLVASASWDKEVRIWSMETGKCKSVLRGHDGSINCVAFSTDPKLVVSGSDDKTVRIWSLETGKCKNILEGHDDWVNSVAVSHDAKLVASAADDMTVRIWSAGSGQCKHVLKGHSDDVHIVAFSDDAKRVASASHDKTVRIWSVETAKCERIIELGFSPRQLDIEKSEAYLGTDARSNSSRLEGLGLASEDSLSEQCSRSISGGVGVDDWVRWITWRERGIIWLPAEYQNGNAAVSGTSIAIGGKTGNVMLISFSAADLERMPKDLTNDDRRMHLAHPWW